MAKIFNVKETEVALLELSRSLLEFSIPPELKTAGAIPLSSLIVVDYFRRKVRQPASRGEHMVLIVEFRWRLAGVRSGFRKRLSN